MVDLLKRGLPLMALVAMAACAPAEPSCPAPTPPRAIDPRKASETEMNHQHDAVVKFQAKTDDYQLCLDLAIKAYKKDPPFTARFYDDGYVDGLETRIEESQKSKEDVVRDFNAAALDYNNAHP